VRYSFARLPRLGGNRWAAVGVTMKAAWYERSGIAERVLVVGHVADPLPGRGEVRIRVAASGVNPGDVKKRQDAFGVGMAFPKIIPHSDGAGDIDTVGDGVDAARVGERVWCYGAQSYRPFGTAAEFVVVPTEQAVPLDREVSYEQGACLGIPGITAHRAVHVAGPVKDRTVLVQGGAGAVGQCAVALARDAGAHVIATVRVESDIPVAEAAGAHEVVCTGQLAESGIVERVRDAAPDGVNHVVEVAFHANIAVDEQLLAAGGTIATYATGNASPAIPFWPLVFKNITVFFLGSDDFPRAEKIKAAEDLNHALEAGWGGFLQVERFSLDAIVKAHQFVESASRGRAVVVIRRE
jgi:NADPH:quinone reductase